MRNSTQMMNCTAPSPALKPSLEPCIYFPPSFSYILYLPSILWQAAEQRDGWHGSLMRRSICKRPFPALGGNGNTASLLIVAFSWGKNFSCANGSSSQRKEEKSHKKWLCGHLQTIFFDKFEYKCKNPRNVKKSPTNLSEGKCFYLLMVSLKTFSCFS